jgi:imidazole glycerol-phosphate synthase subunit HisH
VTRVVILDYGMGNLRSVEKALERVGAKAEITADRERAEAADGLILPGVGAFPRAMDRVREIGLDGLVSGRIEAGVPVLGICLGMQLLFEESEEGGRGLGVLRGPVTRLRAGRVPHMGWNTLRVTAPSALLDGLDGEDVYFAHSFACEPADGVVVAEVEHEGAVAAAVERGAVAGVQFHPERSASPGARVLENVVAWSRSA